MPSNPFRLRNANIPVALTDANARDDEGFVLRDIMVESGQITAISPIDASSAAHERDYDCEGGIVLPRLVDVHTHLDKGQIWHRSPNPDGTFFGARTAVMEDRAGRWSADDVQQRMDFALRCALAHGTGAIRTHLDSVGPQTAISWPLFAEMRETWKDRITLQATAIFPVTFAVDHPDQFEETVTTVARHGGILGGITFLGEAPGPKLMQSLDLVFEAAQAHGLDLDFHVDESGSPDARTLGLIAETALRRGFQGKILAGHCCSLALADDEERNRVIGLLGEASVAVVSLPMCNLYLQDRQAGRTPRWRGVAPVHEIRAAGVEVMVASDNTRDPFYAYGDLDLIEVYREATRILHLDHSGRTWLDTIATTPARIMGLHEAGRIAVGGAADFVVLRARTINELVSRSQSDRVVFVKGERIGNVPPDYRELS